ncbi:phosphomannomutase [Citreimonas sp.]|uniref:phosphomannomutase n=1 Tax=Citreimonas sp. TaxID=3036715 RepID=UPI0035C7DD2B
MAAKFGTSGLRGLVTELSDDVVADYVSAFARACPTGSGVYVGRDLRESSDGIAAQVRRTLAGAGLDVTDCGVLPTPALALAAVQAGAAAIMVTGSHIPADRNGLKFYTPEGEITKAYETAILGALGQAFPDGTDPGPGDDSAARAYAARYVDAFGPKALAGLRIGIYQHSSVARDLMVNVVEALGGQAVPIARSDTFVPVDTEAVDADTRAMLARWCAEHTLDTVISTDGDADRPMVTDETGRIVPGDVLGALTARALGARIVCTPVSSNTLVDLMGFERVARTRIGSPYVIEAMEQAVAAEPAARVVGYEANGGFLLGFEAEGPEGRLAPLPTRDCLLPILAPLAHATEGGLAALVAALPRRFTAADRIAGVAPERSQAFIADLKTDRAARDDFFTDPGDEASLDLTDGLRVSFEGGEIVHLRPSGNAPEFRCYAEADDPDRAEALVTAYLEKLRTALA